MFPRRGIYTFVGGKILPDVYTHRDNAAGLLIPIKIYTKKYTLMPLDGNLSKV